MSVNISELREVIDAMESVRSVDIAYLNRDFAHLRTFLKDTQIIDDCRELLFQAKDVDYWQHVKLYSQIQKMDDYYLRAEQALYLLEDIRDCIDLQREMYPIVRRIDLYNRTNDVGQVFYDECLIHLSRFLKSIVTRMEEQESALDYLSIANSILLEEDLLLTKPIEFRNNGDEVDEKLIFMIGEFDAENFFQETLLKFVNDILESPPLQSFGLQAINAGLEVPGGITPKVWKWIRCSSVVIADLTLESRHEKTWSNFNVAYEYGIAKAMGKIVIVLINEDLWSRGRPLPFDVKDDRCIYYKRDDLASILDKLSLHIAAAFATHPKYPLARLPGS